MAKRYYTGMRGVIKNNNQGILVIQEIYLETAEVW